MSAGSLEFHPGFIVKRKILQFMLSRINFFRFDRLRCSSDKACALGVRKFWRYGPCQDSAVFKNSTVKIIFKYKVCFKFSVKSEHGGFVNDAEQFCDEGCAEILKSIYGGNSGLTFE